jgi:hypothetical protein
MANKDASTGTLASLARALQAIIVPTLPLLLFAYYYFGHRVHRIVQTVYSRQRLKKLLAEHKGKRERSQLGDDDAGKSAGNATGEGSESITVTGLFIYPGMCTVFDYVWVL